MLKLIFCACFVTFFSVINCNVDITQVNITLIKKTNGNHERDCTIENPSYNLTMGAMVQINIINNISNSDPNELFYMHHITGNSIYSGFQKRTNIIEMSKSILINDSYTDYELRFYFKWDQSQTSKICNITIHYEVPANTGPCTLRRNQIILFAVFGVLGIIIIVAEAALILYCRSKFKTLSRHSNLTRLKEDEDESDGDRYSTNPKKKDKKFTPIIPVDNRQSEIYEEPSIILGAPPPLPPGIPTSRADHSNTSTLKMPPSPQTNGNSYPTFPRSKHPIPAPLSKVSVADRPPLPLPDEFYSEAVEEDDVYEQPPDPQSQQSQKSLPPAPKPFLPPPQQLPSSQKPALLQKLLHPAQKQFPPPQNQVLPPQKQFIPPQKQLPSPQKEFPPTQKQFPPPQEPSTHIQFVPAQKPISPPQKQFPPPQKQEPPPQKQFPAPQKQFPPPQNPQTSTLKKPNSHTRAIQEQLATKLQLDKPLKPPISKAKPTPPRNKNVPSAARIPSPPAPKPQPSPKVVLKPVAVKPKPPPISPTTLEQQEPLAAKPKPPALSPTTLEQQVQFFNQHRDDLPHYSSDDDDEWTYEPLYNM